MKNYRNWLIFKPIADFYNMFFNNEAGFSWRKIAATAGVGFAYLAFNRLKDEKYILESGNIWLVFAGICIGLVAVPELIKVVSIIFTRKDNEKTQE